MPEQSHPPYATGATTIPRTLYRWLDINPQNGPLTRTETYITLPVFNVAYSWKGYSDIIASFNFEGPNNFSLTSLQNELPVAPNYFLCISWRTVSGKVYRYALWNQIGEILFFNAPPLYTGQLIKKNFRLEIWSTSQGSPVINPTPINFYTSVAGQQDYRFGVDTPLISADPVTTSFSISGTGAPVGSIVVANGGYTQLNGTYIQTGTYLSFPIYTILGWPPQSSPQFNTPQAPIIFSNVAQWFITKGNAGSPPPDYNSNGVNPSTPDQVVTWVSRLAALPVPSVTASSTTNFALPFVFPNGACSQPNPDTGTVVTVFGSTTLPTYLQPSSQVIVYYISTTQLVEYVNGSLPNPPNPNQPAYGYDPAGNLPAKGWDPTNQSWN